MDWTWNLEILQGFSTLGEHPQRALDSKALLRQDPLPLIHGPGCGCTFVAGTGAWPQPAPRQPTRLRLRSEMGV